MTLHRHSERQSGAILVVSGPANPELPHRYGCGCGAIWNASAPLDDTTKALCGPHCVPRLFRLEDS